MSSLGSISGGKLISTKDIVVNQAETRAFIAGGTKGLQVINIENKASPSVVVELSTSGDAESLVIDKDE